MISLIEARVLAELEADSCFSDFVSMRPRKWLQDEVIEEENCWLFLKAKDIVFLKDYAQYADSAIVVSKKGTVLTVADHHGDKVILKKYLNKISNNLKANNE